MPLSVGCIYAMKLLLFINIKQTVDYALADDKILIRKTRQINQDFRLRNKNNIINDY